MTATQVLAPGNTQATSTDITVAAGAVALVGIYCATDAKLDPDIRFEVVLATPGAVNRTARLREGERSLALTGPGTFRVVRPLYVGPAFGVFADLG